MIQKKISFYFIIKFYDQPPNISRPYFYDGPCY